MISTEQTQKKHPGLKYQTKLMSRKRIKNIHPLIEKELYSCSKILKPKKDLKIGSYEAKISYIFCFLFEVHLSQLRIPTLVLPF